MQEVRGKRGHSVRYVHAGYEYHVDTTSPHLYRCSTRQTTKCRGAAEVIGRPPHQRVNVYTPHEGHPPNPTIVEEAAMRDEMIDLAITTNDTPKSIFDAVCARNPIEVAQKLLFPAMKSAMDRARRQFRPVVPASLRELAGVLESHEPTVQMYRGLVEADNSVGLLFISNEMLEVLETASEIFIDGTFKVAPNQPPIAQLYTIHVRIMDTGLAAVFVLCSDRTSALYRSIFRRILELAPGIGENLRFVMGDYERAAMSAIHEVFPRASLHGCWFHFNQALERRWRSLGLSDAPVRILGLAMALPLAPAANFAEGLGLLAEIADTIAADHPHMLQLMLYMRRQWGPLAEAVSVHGCPVRTNNLVESFHNEAKRKLGGLHPNIWKFIDHLREIIINQGVDLARLRNGDRPRRARAVKNMARDVLIRNAQQDLGVGRLTLMEFLRRCATRVPPLHRFQPGYSAEEEGAADPVEDLVPPGLLAVEDPEVDEPVRRGGRRGQPRNIQPEQLPEDEAENLAHVPGRGRGRGRARAVRRGRGGRARDRARGRGGELPAQNEPAVDEPDEPEPLNGDDDRVRGEDDRVRGEDDWVRGEDDRVREEDDRVRGEDDRVRGEDDRIHQLIHEIDVLVQEVQPAPAAAPEPEPAPEHRNTGAPEPAVAPAQEAPGGLPDRPNCCACMSRPATHAYIPCGHKCCCAHCVANWPLNCPLCRMECIGAFQIHSP